MDAYEYIFFPNLKSIYFTSLERGTKLICSVFRADFISCAYLCLEYASGNREPVKNLKKNGRNRKTERERYRQGSSERDRKTE